MPIMAWANLKRFLSLLLWLGLVGGVELYLPGLSLGVPVGQSPAGTYEVEPAAPAAASFSVLVFTKTAAFRHASIAPGIAAVKSLGQAHGFQVDATEDATVFTNAQLAAYRVIIFLNTSGDILDANQQAAFQQFIRDGGGFVGIHSATDTEYDWPWYGGLVGAYFASHPAIQPATVQVRNFGHPSTRPLPWRWSRTDEWYNFRNQPAPQVTILAELDETTYTGGAMGASHPIVWSHLYEGGRAWYTAMGHTSESYGEPLFLDHLLGGILWAAGAAEARYFVYLPILLKP